MARKRDRANGDGDVYPRRGRDGKVIGYRGAYWVHTAAGPKRRYVSGKTKSETRGALRKAKEVRDSGLLPEVGSLTLGKYSWSIG